MNIPLLSKLAHLIEEILKAEGPAIGQAVAGAAVATAEQDPKVEAVTAAAATLLMAAQQLKSAASDPTGK